MSLQQFKSNILKLQQIINKHIKNQNRKNLIISIYQKYLNIMYISPGLSDKTSKYYKQGGWLEYVTQVLNNSFNIKKMMVSNGYKLDFTDEELLVVCLFFNFGVLGTQHQPLMCKNDQNSYKYKNGMLYQFNSQLHYMKTFDRSLFLLNQQGLKLSLNEYLAIRLSWGLYQESDKIYFQMEKQNTTNKLNIVHILNSSIDLAQQR